jgi:DNA-binding SARP family transcriptional activator
MRVACLLCRGELLAGLDVKEADFERWLTLQRARTRQLSIEVHERYVDHLLERNELTKGIQTGIRLIALDPLSERAHRAMMTLYARQGQLGAVRRQYELCADILSRELNMEPSSETQRLREELIAGRTLGRQILGPSG